MNINNKKGFSLVELIVAIGVFAILAAGVTYVATNTYSNFYGASDRQAVYEYAQEGVEAIKAMQANSWQDLEDASAGNNGLAKNASGIWTFSGSSDTRGVLTRTVQIEDAQRDGNGDIADSGTVDPNTKKITVTISASGIDDFVLVSYVTNWEVKVWHQTSWDSGDSEFYNNNTYASSSFNVSTTTSGQLDLNLVADPLIDPKLGTISLKFESNKNYTLQNLAVRDFEGDGMLFLDPQNYDIYDQLEDSNFSNWYASDSLSQSTASLEYDDSVAYGLLQELDQNTLNGAFGGIDTNRVLIISYKQIIVHTTGDETFFGGHQNSKTPDAYGLITFGWNGDSVVCNTCYLYKIKAGSEVSTGVTADTDWHHLVIRTNQATTVDGNSYNHRIFLDGVTEYSYSCNDWEESCASPGSLLWNHFQLLQYDGSDQVYVDEIIMSPSNTLYEQGTSTIDIWPNEVESFDSVSTTDLTASGRWQGTTEYEFQFSTDAGANFGTNSPGYDDDNWSTLNTANLAGLSVGTDGNDILRVRIKHTPSSSHFNTLVPRTDQVVINYTDTETELSGWLYSSIYDTGNSNEYQSISVEQNIPSGCAMPITVETDSDPTFSSPATMILDGDNSSYYTTSTDSGLNGNRYIRYKVGMVSCNSGTEGPTLNDIKIRYK